jgi:hypothetical protein
VLHGRTCSIFKVSLNVSNISHLNSTPRPPLDCNHLHLWRSKLHLLLLFNCFSWLLLYSRSIHFISQFKISIAPFSTSHFELFNSCFFIVFHNSTKVALPFACIHVPLTALHFSNVLSYSSIILFTTCTFYSTVFTCYFYVCFKSKFMLFLNNMKRNESKLWGENIFTYIYPLIGHFQLSLMLFVDLSS